MMNRFLYFHRGEKASMGFTCGIIGLPNVGKSTLFNAIATASAHVANYPFCTIEPNIGIVQVPDKRLKRLSEIYQSQSIVPTTLEFFDIAGLVKGASTGEGLGNQFLSHIRTVDAIAHVVRCFDDENIVHVNGDVRPVYDIEIVETELILKDVETVGKKQTETEKRIHTGDKKAAIELEFYSILKRELLSGKSARTISCKNVEEQIWLQNMQLLTAKPMMYICNVHEKDLSGDIEYIRQVKTHAQKERTKVVIISAEIESEIAQLKEEERQPFLSELGLKESGLTKIIHEGYDLLHLQTFFTTGVKETRAWTAQHGTTAIHAAGKIHSDFERGFIRAEIIKYNDIDRLGSEAAIREAGLLHVEGRDYIIRDGDVMFVKFNV